jgi:dipeptidyl aminopeptidase/acylaminoacyl peptidase
MKTKTSLERGLFASLALCALWSLTASISAAQGRHPITFDDLMRVHRVDDPQVSPDGRSIVFTVANADVEANKMVSHLWLVPLAGGEPRQITRGSGSDNRPRWSPDGHAIAFISTRGGTPQIWILPLEGGEAHPLTSISTGADGVTWAARGHELVFTSDVYPDCPDAACNQKRSEDAEHSPVKARIIDQLLFRHWNEWCDGKYTHLFAVAAEGGNPRDLTPGAYDSPTFFLGAPDGYAISPDGAEVCYTSNHEKGSAGQSAAAWTTDNHLYLVPSSGGEARDITPGVHGSDAAPQYSPDGRYIAYTAQDRNGYESDLFRLRVYDRQNASTKELTPGFDQWVSSFSWAPDSDTIYFVAADHAVQPIFKTSVSHRAVEKILEGMLDEVSVTPDSKTLVLTHTSLTQPTEIYRASTAGAGLAPVTQLNQDLLGTLEMNSVETIETKGALGASIGNLVVKPPNFDPNKKYPGLMLIHGGPQSAWEDAWGYRWNAQMFAAHGYVVMMTNFHGSTGYGQKFVEEISGDWGGAPYQDQMLATDYLASLPYVDPNRIGAAGASFGGFMINWIAGHTNRFKALVSHDGIVEEPSMYGETEEIWFEEWEHHGTPWENHDLYEKWSPANSVQNIRTPMLIVEGGRDYRVPEGQAFQLFTALQRRGVPSRLLYFPDEGHWVMKPQNSRLWYHTVLDWLDHYLKP